MMMEELKNEVMEEAKEIVENTEIPVEVVGRGFNKGVALVCGVVTGVGVGAVALWKNRKKIAEHFEKKQVAKMQKKGYLVTKVVENSDGVKLVPIEEESK